MDTFVTEYLERAGYSAERGNMWSPEVAKLEREAEKVEAVLRTVAVMKRRDAPARRMPRRRLSFAAIMSVVGAWL